MPIMFNSVLINAGLALEDIRLLRHADTQGSNRGCSPFELWRDDHERFLLYQASQTFKNRKRLKAKFWATFVACKRDERHALFKGETLFSGLYRVEYLGLSKEKTPKVNVGGFNQAGECDQYKLELDERLFDLIGRLLIEWGTDYINWIQPAEKKYKPIFELKRCAIPFAKRIASD
jgi:hypothetical protein